MKYQVLFSLKNNEKAFINVVCCSHDLVLSVHANKQCKRPKVYGSLDAGPSFNIPHGVLFRKKANVINFIGDL